MLCLWLWPLSSGKLTLTQCLFVVTSNTSLLCWCLECVWDLPFTFLAGIWEDSSWECFPLIWKLFSSVLLQCYLTSTGSIISLDDARRYFISWSHYISLHWEESTKEAEDLLASCFVSFVYLLDDYFLCVCVLHTKKFDCGGERWGRGRGYRPALANLFERDRDTERQLTSIC